MALRQLDAVAACAHSGPSSRQEGPRRTARVTRILQRVLQLRAVKPLHAAIGHYDIALLVMLIGHKRCPQIYGKVRAQPDGKAAQYAVVGGLRFPPMLWSPAWNVRGEVSWASTPMK